MSNVFWYYMGRVAQHVQVDGESRLISPHSYFLASAGQKFPPRIASLFKQKQPPPDVRKQFEVAGMIASEHREKIAQETRRAEREKAEALKFREEARRKGEKPVERLPLGEAIKEEGKKDPQSEEEPQPKSEKPRSRRRKRGHEFGRAVEEEDKTEDQGEES